MIQGRVKFQTQVMHSAYLDDQSKGDTKFKGYKLCTTGLFKFLVT